jgi:pimeloyl-ACP methyl ester carboxylesterase
MTFPRASRFADHHDIVLVGYRGVDGSSVLDCPEVETALRHSTDFLGTKSFHAYGTALHACANRLTGDGVDLAGYSLVQRVDDLEDARRALGLGRIDLLSESAGTRTAMIYSWRYPKSIRRSVMIGANPPGHYLWSATRTDEQIRRYSALCAGDHTCSRRTGDLALSMTRTAREIPDHWLFLPIKKGNVRVASFYGLMESTSEAAPISAPMTLSSWLSATQGDASGFWFVSLLADLAFPKSFVWGELAATGTTDAAVARRYFSSKQPNGSILGNPGTDFIWGGGALADAWPTAPDAREYSRVRTAKTETLLIGGSLDVATPPQVATKELLPFLPNGHQVVLPGFGHANSFWTEQPNAGSRLINTFFDTGRVDRSLYEPERVDFTPEVTQTALGKGLAGAMVGLAALTVLSLLWLPLRVHRRGRFGRKTRVVLRTIYPILLGVGGWFLGVLVVITAMPGVPVDDELLSSLSIGVPIGLGVYFGWVQRDWSAATKATGFVAAVGGALVAGWLGFSAADGLLALVTTIVGAAAGANLTLLVLDIAWDRQARDRHAVKAGAATSVPALTG